VDFRVLGPLEVHEGGAPLPLGAGRRMRTLLALFLANPNRALSADTLIDQVWLDDPPPSAATALRVHLTRLRARLEPNRPSAVASERITTEPNGYRLAIGRDELDSLRFEHFISLARQETSRALAARLYADAEALWRGAAFADIDDVDSIRAEAARLHELRAVALEERFDIQLALGEHAAVVGAMQSAVDEYPLRERLAAQLMLALYRSGRQGEALRAYTDLRVRLGEELGIEPDLAVSRLETAILQHDESLDLPDDRARDAATGSAPGSTILIVTDRAVPNATGRAIDAPEGFAYTFSSAIDALDCAADTLRVNHQARIGISAGELSASNADDAAGVLLEAAALRATAPAGAIVASDVVVALAGEHPTLQFDAPTRVPTAGGASVIAAVGRLASAADVDAIVPMPALLVDEVRREFAGRGAELERIAELRRSGDQSRPHTMLILGEPGVGKTRLAAEAATRAHADGSLVLYGRCDETLRIPFQPFVDALEFFIGSTPAPLLRDRLGEHAGDLTRLVPSLAGRLAEAEALTSDPETERYRMFQAVAEWLRVNARRQPTMLIIDDVHWAAPPTLLLLRHLVRTADLAGLQIIATFRDTRPERGDELDEVLADLSRERHVTRCELGGLDVNAVRELIAGSALTSESDRAGDLAEIIHAETGGNPFFVHELLRFLPEEDALENVRTTVPPTVRDLIAQRLAHLPDATEELLTIASVIGRHFDFAVLRAVSNVDEDDVLFLLDTALGARLVHETAFDEYRFSHALVQSALYQPLSETRRVRLHRRVAEALELEVGDDTEQRLPELAHHFLEAAPAGVTDKALQYAGADAESALQGLAFEDAANMCRRALAVIERARADGEVVDRTVEHDLLLVLGRAELGAGQRSARRTLLQAFALARELEDPDRMAQSALAMNRGFFSRMGRVFTDAVGSLEDAIAAQPPTDTNARAELLAALASELVWATDDDDRRFRISDEALAMARRVGDPRTTANVLLRRNMTINCPDTLAERVEQCDELLNLAGDLGDPVLAFHAAFHRSGTAMEAGRVDDADLMVERAWQLARELAQPAILFQATMMQTSRSLFHGDLESAEQSAYAMLELGERSDQHSEAVMFFGELMLEIRRWQGRLDEMLPQFGDLAGVEEIDFSYPLLRNLYDAGEEKRALARYAEIIATVRFPLRRDLLAGPTLCHLGYLAARAGDTANALRIAEALDPLRGCFANTTVAKHVTEHFLGMLAACNNDVDRAQEMFAIAAAAHERVNAPLFLAETQVEWARLLVKSGTDLSRAATLLEDARAAATRLGAGFLQREAAQLRRSVPTD
jgi:DNA-binding SARP family transcriptional activator